MGKIIVLVFFRGFYVLSCSLRQLLLQRDLDHSEFQFHITSHPLHSASRHTSQRGWGWTSQLQVPNTLSSPSRSKLHWVLRIRWLCKLDLADADVSKHSQILGRWWGRRGVGVGGLNCKWRAQWLQIRLKDLVYSFSYCFHLILILI